MSKDARDHRNSDVTKIQIARKQLALSDEDYRAILQAQGNVTSSKELTHEGRIKVLAYFKATYGWVPKAGTSSKRPRRPQPSPDRAPMVRRIRAQLISLGKLPDEYADGIAKQMLGKDAPEFFQWCQPRDLYKISQALGVEQQRKGVPTQ